MANRLAQAPGWIIGAAAFVSLVLHASGVVVLDKAKLTDKKEENKVRIRIVEKKEEPKVEPVKKEEPPPQPKPKPKPKPIPKQVATERPKNAETPPKEPPKPVMGLDQNSFDTSGKSSVSAPMGNTLMMEDTGERVDTPPAPMDTDLSSDAQLIRDSFAIPSYTEAALDAGLEGVVFVDVHVDANGNVLEAELRKKVGYGMDAKIVEAVLSARFVPRKNRLGRPEATWTEIKFTLQIP